MTVAQTTYYVASSGNDGNNGRSSGSPFQTIARINTLSLQPGDQVLFQRNDTFRGNLQIRQSGAAGNPIVIDAYGSGNKPILAGSVPVTNWVGIGNNVWQADCPTCGDQVTGLYRDNSALPLGRYPNLNAGNRGYLTIQSHAGKSQITSQQGLPANFTGGEAVYRPVQWIMNRAKITGQSGNTLFINDPNGYDISDNWGYFVQNHPATLDQAGEWCYNSATKKIQLYDGANPNNQSIAATAFANAVNLSGVSHITVRNVQLTQSLFANVSVTNSSNLVFGNNDVTQAGEDGIVLLGSGTQVLMENNVIDNINNNGVDIATYQNVTFRGSTVRNIGLVPGRGRGNDGQYVGFQSKSTANTLIEDNVFDNIGYIGVDFSNRTVVQRNRISNFCLTKSDGSGLYTWNGNRLAMSDIRLLSNIVYNGIGAPEGTPGGSYSGANGIYLDDCTTNVEIANNSVYNCVGYGVYLHGTSDVRMTGNTVYNNGETQLAITHAYNCQPRNNLIQNNILVSRSPDVFVAKYESGQNDIASYGQFDNNVYARPFNDTQKIFFYNGSTGGALSLVDWQNRYGLDRTSANSPLTYTSGNPDDYIKHIANPTGAAIQVPLNGTYRDMRNNVVSGQVTVPAFSSVVLLREVNQTPPPTPTTLRDPENPANAVTGLDYGYYEGFWTNLPDFNALTAVKTGTTNAINPATVRNRADSYALRYTGFVSVPTDGAYTFYTSSDDGSKLFIGTTEVVNNDGGHGDQERSGTIGLKAGVHAITLTYFQGGGGQSLSASYSGPGLGKQTIPDAAFRRVSNGQTTPPPPTPTPSNLRDPENPANAVAGLNYGYYEGSWNMLPDFNALTPVKTGVHNTANLTVRNRDDNFGLRYTGFVSVPTDGTYTFYTNSDDGSKLFIGTTEVVNNDGGHPEQERAGSIGLKAGVHALTVIYYEGGGGEALSASYSGPGLGKQTIPDAAFRRVANGQTTPPPPTPTPSNLRDPENPANAVTGLDYGYYEGFWNLLPNFNALAPVKTGTTNAINPATVRNRADSYALRYTGFVSVPTDGAYTFYTASDDGSKLFIGTTEVVSNDGEHGDQERSGTIGLKAGVHAITLTYFQGGGGQSLSASYSGPGLGKQIIPDAAFRRVSNGQTTPPPPTPTPSNLRDPENPANAVAGLNYGYYEGSWNMLPDFNALTPVKTGVHNTANLTVRNRDDNFGLRYTGFVSVPTDGTYTFYTNSDDGSKLFIGTTEVVNNDGGHPEQERAGSIGLKAGVHALTVIYYEGGGGEALSASYSGPGLGKQTIPDAAFRRVANGQTTPPPPTSPAGNGTGLRAEYFNNRTLALPFAMTRTDAVVDFNWGDSSPAPGTVIADNFTARWTGQVEVPVTGSYLFSTESDDGTRLWVNGVQLINDWNGHAALVINGAPMTLTAGQRYDIRLEYLENGGGALARLLWSYPGQSQQIVPKERLYPAANSFAGGRLAADGEAELKAEIESPLMQVYPVPAQDVVWVRYYAKTAGEATLQLTNTTAQPVLETTHQVRAGENVFKVAVDKLNRGMYMLTLINANQRLTHKVLLMH